MVYSLRIQVSKADIDELGHVNNVVYLRYVQEAASAHWNSITSDEIKKTCLWVVLRHEIDYVSPAFEGDSLIASTWVGETTGPRSERFVEIKNEKTNKMIVKAKTTWCMIDNITLRPKRVDESIIHLLKGTK